MNELEVLTVLDGMNVIHQLMLSMIDVLNVVEVLTLNVSTC
jgi:hypothetical protein